MIVATDARIEDVLDARPASRRRAERGYTPAERWVIEVGDGRSVFIKAATNDLTAGWLRNEHRIYEALQATFMPGLIGWRDDERPILVVEDLSAGVWPPPWTDERVASVRRGPSRGNRSASDSRKASISGTDAARPEVVSGRSRR